MGASISNEISYGLDRSDIEITRKQRNSVEKPLAAKTDKYLHRRQRFKCRNKSDSFASSRNLVLDLGSPSYDRLKKKASTRRTLRSKTLNERSSRHLTSKGKRNGNLKKKLNGLSKEQLVDLIIQTTELKPSIKKKFVWLCEAPNLMLLKARLESFLSEIYRAFPTIPFGSMRGDFCYRRTEVHLKAFKDECIHQCENLLSFGPMSLVLEYSLDAWPVVARLPDWNRTSHNEIKKHVFCHLAVQMRKSVKKLEFSTEELIQLKKRIEEEENSQLFLLPVLEEIMKKLS